VAGAGAEGGEERVGARDGVGQTARVEHVGGHDGEPIVVPGDRGEGPDDGDHLVTGIE
jgi:hypothetical protein